MKYTSCFIGIPLPKEFLEDFSKLSTEVKEIFHNIELADVSTPHITIYYLNQKSQEDITEITKIVKKSINLIKGSRLEVGGMGVFGSEAQKVLYLQVEYKLDIINFKNAIEQELTKYGAIDNNLEFTPHITIGRVLNYSSANEFLKKKKEFKSLLEKINWSFEINKVSIFGVNSRKTPEKQEKLIDI